VVAISLSIATVAQNCATYAITMLDWPDASADGACPVVMVDQN